jgi:serine/threonine protein kinase
VALGQPLDPLALDVWSLGVMLYTMLTGSPLYSSPHDPAFRLLARGGAAGLIRHYEAFGLCLTPAAADLVCRMLDADTATRITVQQIRRSPWVQADSWGAAEGSHASPSGEGGCAASRVRWE